MKTLTTPITLANWSGNINKVGVVGFLDYSHMTSPCAKVICQAIGAGGSTYPGPGYMFTLRVFDQGNCDSLAVNPTPIGITDQLLIVPVSLTGTPFTTTIQLYMSTSGNRASKLLALENQMIAWGLWTSAFAGT